MKKILLITLTLILTLAVLASCDNGPDSEGNDTAAYSFKSGEVTVTPHAEASDIVSALGDPSEYVESTSCGFDGLDKTYVYNSFKIVTYPKDGKDYIYTVTLKSDLVSTPEGITVGRTRDEVIAKYGDKYTEIGENIVYTAGKTELQFLFRDGKVSSVKYVAVME